MNFGGLLSPGTFDFFARFLLAGYVLMIARARFVAGERPRLADALVEAIILSLINHSILRGLLLLVRPLAGNVGPTDVPLFVEALLLPAILGVASGWLVSLNRVPDGLRRLIFPVTRPDQQAYSHAFATVESPCFVIVSYQDGRKVLGFFGERSLAGSDPATGGFFIEDLYSLGKTEEWQRADPPRSAWLSLDGVRSIEFLQSSGGRSGQGSG